MNILTKFDQNTIIWSIHVVIVQRPSSNQNVGTKLDMHESS